MVNPAVTFKPGSLSFNPTGCMMRPFLNTSLATRNIIAACLLISLSACSSLNLNPLKRQKPLLKADAEHPVIEVICLWQAAEGQGLDGMPTRGFAGQILFFAQGYTEPCLVDGDVTIYVFDDHGDSTEQAKPLRVFQFESEVWQQYARETSLGAGHQIFLPYTRPGAHHAECALKVRFTPKQGSPQFSRMAHVVLSGVKSKNQLTRIDAPRLDAVTPVSSTVNDATSPSQVMQADYVEQRDVPRHAPSETIRGEDVRRPAIDTAHLSRLIDEVAPEARPAAERQSAPAYTPAPQREQAPADITSDLAEASAPRHSFRLRRSE